MDPQQNRFVVLKHEPGSQLARTEQAHVDWMFEVDRTLRTWATQAVTRFDEPMDLACDSLDDHRIAYLDYEGEIGGDRGCVVRLMRGTYRLVDRDANQFVAEIFWHSGGNLELDATETVSPRRAVVTCYRSLPETGLRVDESRDCWRLRFSPGR